MMNNREQIEQSVISASAYNGNDTEGLLKEIEDVYKKAQAFDEILKGLPNAMQDESSTLNWTNSMRIDIVNLRK